MVRTRPRRAATRRSPVPGDGPSKKATQTKRTKSRRSKRPPEAAAAADAAMEEEESANEASANEDEEELPIAELRRRKRMEREAKAKKDGGQSGADEGDDEQEEEEEEEKGSSSEDEKDGAADDADMGDEASDGDQEEADSGKDVSKEQDQEDTKPRGRSSRRPSFETTHKPTRRSKRQKHESSEEEASEEATEKPSRRSRLQPSAKATSNDDEGPNGEADKAKPRRRSKRRDSKEQAESASEEEPQSADENDTTADEKPLRRSRRGAPAENASDKADGEEVEELTEKATRRSKRRASRDATDSASDDGDGNDSIPERGQRSKRLKKRRSSGEGAPSASDKGRDESESDAANDSAQGPKRRSKRSTRESAVDGTASALDDAEDEKQSDVEVKPGRRSKRRKSASAVQSASDSSGVKKDDAANVEKEPQTSSGRSKDEAESVSDAAESESGNDADKDKPGRYSKRQRIEPSESTSVQEESQAEDETENLVTGANQHTAAEDDTEPKTNDESEESESRKVAAKHPDEVKDLAAASPEHPIQLSESQQPARAEVDLRTSEDQVDKAGVRDEDGQSKKQDANGPMSGVPPAEEAKAAEEATPEKERAATEAKSEAHSEQSDAEEAGNKAAAAAAKSEDQSKQSDAEGSVSPKESAGAEAKADGESKLSDAEEATPEKESAATAAKFETQSKQSANDETAKESATTVALSELKSNPSESAAAEATSEAQSKQSDIVEATKESAATVAISEARSQHSDSEEATPRKKVVAVESKKSDVQSKRPEDEEATKETAASAATSEAQSNESDAEEVAPQESAAVEAKSEDPGKESDIEEAAQQEESAEVAMSQGQSKHSDAEEAIPQKELAPAEAKSEAHSDLPEAEEAKNEGAATAAKSEDQSKQYDAERATSPKESADAEAKADIESKQSNADEQKESADAEANSADHDADRKAVEAARAQDLAAERELESNVEFGISVETSTKQANGEEVASSLDQHSEAREIPIGASDEVPTEEAPLVAPENDECEQVIEKHVVQDTPVTTGSQDAAPAFEGAAVADSRTAEGNHPDLQSDNAEEKLLDAQTDSEQLAAPSSTADNETNHKYQLTRAEAGDVSRQQSAQAGSERPTDETVEKSQESLALVAAEVSAELKEHATDTGELTEEPPFMPGVGDSSPTHDSDEPAEQAIVTVSGVGKSSGQLRRPMDVDETPTLHNSFADGHSKSRSDASVQDVHTSKSQTEESKTSPSHPTHEVESVVSGTISAADTTTSEAAPTTSGQPTARGVTRTADAPPLHQLSARESRPKQDAGWTPSTEDVDSTFAPTSRAAESKASIDEQVRILSASAVEPSETAPTASIIDVSRTSSASAAEVDVAAKTKDQATEREPLPTRVKSSGFVTIPAIAPAPKPEIAEMERPIKQPKLNISRVKTLLFSIGGKVHGRLGYEVRFAEYWGAVSMRLEGDLSDGTIEKTRSIIDSFLRTNKLRKLHNKLVMGLIERCLVPTCLSSEVLPTIPAPLRTKVKPFSNEKIRDQAPSKQPSKPEEAMKHPPVGASSHHYSPIMLETPLARPFSAHYPAKTSFRIPGAMAIDPYMRALAQAKGMKATDNSIWLLVVAMREFTKAMLKGTIGSMEAIDSGEVPPYPRLRNRVLHKKRDLGGANDMPVDKKQKVEVAPVKCITAHDLHVFTSSMSIGHSRAIGGTISRPVFERSLLSSLNSCVLPGGKGFDEVRRFITSNLGPHIPRRLTNAPSGSSQAQGSAATQVASAAGDQPVRTSLVQEKPAPPSAPNAPLPSTMAKPQAMPALPPKAVAPTTPREKDGKGRKSPQSGLGRGAKDLASLKARASFTQRTSSVSEQRPSQGGESSMVAAAALVATEVAAAGSQNQSSAPVAASVAAPVLAKGPSTPVPAAQVPAGAPDPVGTSPAPPPGAAVESAQACAARRGKGFGTKNLAAMRARSVTSKPEDESSASTSTAAAAGAVAAEEIQTASGEKPKDADPPKET